MLVHFRFRVNFKPLLGQKFTNVLQGSCRTRCHASENQLLVHAVGIQLDDGNPRVVAVQFLTVTPFLDIGFIVETLLVVVDGLQVVGIQNAVVRIHHNKYLFQYVFSSYSLSVIIVYTHGT